jgi:hypothetical protein
MMAMPRCPKRRWMRSFRRAEVMYPKRGERKTRETMV